MLNEFIDYLKKQVGQPYVWGGQHTELRPDNYISVIERKEQKATGSYSDMTYAEAAINFCRKKFEAGATVLYGYDCSGLGMYWLQNVKHIFTTDMSADTLMRTQCYLNADSDCLPKKGWWVFRTDSTRKATHIGYMISDTHLIEAKGRKYGVVETEFKKKDWSVWGIPEIFDLEIDGSEDEPEETETEVEVKVDEEEAVPEEPAEFVEVIGDSVNIRDKDNKTGKVILIAHSKHGWRKKGISHSNDKYKLLDVAPTGWYHIETPAGKGYITNLEKYTRLVK